MYDVFLSYTNDDKAIAQKIVEHFLQNNISVFDTTVQNNKPYWEFVEQGAQESKAIVILFSNSYNESDSVDKELEILDGFEIPKIVVKTTTTKARGAKRYYLSSFPAVQTSEKLEQLIQMVGEKVSNVLKKEEAKHAK